MKWLKKSRQFCNFSRQPHEYVNEGPVFCGNASVPLEYSRFQKKSNVLFTDPPYCLLERRRRHGDLRDAKPRPGKLDHETTRRFRDLRDYSIFTNSWLDASLSQIQQDATIIVWTNALGRKIISDSLISRNCVFKGEYVWAKLTKTKPESSVQSETILRIYETALVFLRGKPWSEERPCQDPSLPWCTVSGYHESDKEPHRHEHPCHKPFQVLHPLLLQWTRPGDAILDCFAGSGAILEAASKIGQREVYGLELLPHWANYSNLQINRSRTLVPPID